MEKLLYTASSKSKLSILLIVQYKVLTTAEGVLNIGLSHIHGLKLCNEEHI